MWRILQAVLATGDTLPFGDGFDHETFLAHWFGSHPALVATQGADVVGMYKLGPNYPGRGSHIDAFLQVIDWQAVAQRFQAAM